LAESAEHQLFKISGVRAVGVVNFERYTLEDALVKASEMMQDGMGHLTITASEGHIIDEAKILDWREALPRRARPRCDSNRDTLSALGGR
jgi:hypothetical protein